MSRVGFEASACACSERGLRWIYMPIVMYGLETLWKTDGVTQQSMFRT